ncbi:MAG: HNH endonuclease [Flammeovirgaceae bacterium]|nr:HNH endonuclease [Flammeovirgaceae bacterium]MDW8288203.1 HNH endonuclease [Flammeovirgaceae bacterium]
MLYKLKLKNSDKHVVISDEVYEFITNNEYYKSIQFLENLREHSSGYVFYQRNYPTKNGKYKNVTIYLHKLIAEKFLPRPEGAGKRLFVRIKNGNPMDCRLKNLEWTTMSELRRNQKQHSNKTGYRGVVKVGFNSYRAIIYSEKKRIDLGLYDTPEEAAAAYNKKSEELFGKTKSLNKISESAPASYSNDALPTASPSTEKKLKMTELVQEEVFGGL